MKARKILPSVKRGKFRCDDALSDEGDKGFKLIKPFILKRDMNTCQYCGLKSSKYQEVHHLDDNHFNNDEDNLITICSLCHACFHIGFTGQNNKGVIIYLDPAVGLSQESLNEIVRTLWIGEKSNDQSIRMLSVNNLARLYKQTIPADRKLGTSDAVVLGDFLLQLEDEDYENRGNVLKGFYLLPLKDGFVAQLNHWEKENFKNIPSTEWLSVATQKATKWSENMYGETSDEHILTTINNKK